MVEEQPPHYPEPDASVRNKLGYVEYAHRRRSASRETGSSRTDGYVKACTLSAILGVTGILLRAGFGTPTQSVSRRFCLSLRLLRVV